MTTNEYYQQVGMMHEITVLKKQKVDLLFSMKALISVNSQPESPELKKAIKVVHKVQDTMTIEERMAENN